MQPANVKRAGLLALLITVVAITAWEIHLRNTRMPISFDDNEALWANKRQMVYAPRDQVTVFIGSSRIKYDLDIPTWESLTGEKAIQLANLGSSPRSVLTDLANDNNFAGKLVIDVTEGLFFADFSPRDVETYRKIKYFHSITPTQQASFEIDRVLESKFLFLDQESFSFNAMMDEIKIPPRPGVFRLPIFPVEFHGGSFARQSYMTPEFVADTNLQNRVKRIWKVLGGAPGPPPARGEKLQSIFNSVKADIDKIKSRGGEIIFTRTPSSGPFREGEKHGFPRDVYWDGLLHATGCQGIYFEDYPATANLVCVEWSHLKVQDAKIYTESLVSTLKQKGWSFNNKKSSL